MCAITSRLRESFQHLAKAGESATSSRCHDLEICIKGRAFAWFVWANGEIGRALIMEVFGPSSEDSGESKCLSMMIKNLSSGGGMTIFTMPFPR